MLYLRKSFTLPTSEKVSQRRWDEIFLPLDEFCKKYGAALLPDSELVDDVWPKS